MKNSEMWAGIVGNAAEALRHPGLTAAVRNMHPGVMPEAKSAGIAGYAEGGLVAENPLNNLSLSGYVSPEWEQHLASGDRSNNVVFAEYSHPSQGMSPDERQAEIAAMNNLEPFHTVGTKRAKGSVLAYAQGGPVASSDTMPDPSDPRMGAIADAEDALGTIESGQPLEPHHIAALHTFNNTYGPTALGHLHANVKAGMTMRRPSAPRVVVGPTGKDKVPALVNGTHQAKLTTGEFVMPVDAVAGAGHGDPVAGAQKLQQLSATLAAMHPAKEVKPLTPAKLARQVAPVQSMQPPLPGAPSALNVDRVG